MLKKDENGNPYFSVEANRILATLFTSKNGITFDFCPYAQTATVDMNKKHIKMPVFTRELPIEVSDYFLTHECAHLMYTYPKFFEKIEEEIDFPKNHAGIVHGIFNVVEDIRIEKLVQEQYPSLREIYRVARSVILDKGIFTTDNNEKVCQENVQTQHFITRANIFFKSNREDLIIDFTDDERVFIEKMKRQRTIDDCIQIVKELYELMKQQQEESDDQEDQQIGDHQSGSEGSSSNPSESQDVGQTSDDGDSSDSDNQEESDNDPADTSNDQDDSDSSSQSQDESDDPSQTESEEDDGSLEQDQGRLSDVDLPPLPQGGDDGDGILIEININYENYLSKSISSASSVEILDTEHFKASPVNRMNGVKGLAYDDVRKLVSKSRKFASHAASIFKSKMAAENYKKTRIDTTGNLCPKKLWSTSVGSDDIFLSREIHHDGKNHGIAVFIDLSGSMMGYPIKELGKQLLNTIEFCENLSLPYIIFGHSDYREGAASNSNISLGRFSSFVFTHDKASKKEKKKARDIIISWITTGKIGLSTGTSIRSMMVESLNDVIDFRKRHNIQIMHTIVMTDGVDTSFVTRNDGLPRNEIFKSDIIQTKDNYRFVFNKDENRTYTPWDKIAEVYGVMTNSFMTYMRFVTYDQRDNSYKNVASGVKHKFNEYGFHQTFLFNASPLVCENVPDNIEDATDVTDMKKYAKIAKRGGLFIEIFATSIAEAEGVK